MSSAAVHWEVRHRVGHIVLNRPERANVIDAPFAHALAAAVQAARHADIGAVLIRAHGRQFSVGGDIAAFAQHRQSLSPLVAKSLELLHPTMHQLASLPLPVISAIQGPVGGGGIGLGLCADLVLASTAMHLRGGYSAIGLSPDLGVSYFLTRRAGAAKAKHILMCNHTVSAQECLRLGLVDELHEPAQLQEAALALAENLAAGATNALAGIKQLCDRAADQDLASQLDAERAAMLDCTRSGNSAEGVAAFLEKRAPRFQPR